MSQFNGDSTGLEGLGTGAQAPNPAMVVTRRRASINLRDGDSGGVGALMDPANQSLNDALKVTYRLIQFGMIALVAIFALSGFQSIKNYERGVRITFGEVESTDLQPGFAFSWPRPLGEIIRVPTGDESLSVGREFFPNLRPEDANKSLQELATLGGGELKPEQDGFVVTGDLNVAHGKFTAVWFRRPERVRQNVENIQPEDEVKLVQTAVMRGVVHAAARVSVDEFLTGKPDPSRPDGMPDVAETIRAVANSTLDGMKAGIEVRTVTIDMRTEPLSLIGEFAKVQSMQTAALKEIETARQEAVETLQETAGEAGTVLTKLIDAYDVALSSGKAAEAEATLARIDGLLEGREVEMNGERVSARVTGAAAGVISSSQQYRATIAGRAQAEAATFKARLEAFKSNPSVVLISDWADAYRAFLERSTVDVWVLPGGLGTLQLMLNRDPEYVRKLERDKHERDMAAIEAQRAQDLLKAQLEKYKQNEVKKDAR